MGINKEKLLKEIKLKSDDVDVTWVCSFIKTFPEEPEQRIDFDALFDDWLGSDNFRRDDSGELVFEANHYNDFLKSKNLTAPKPVEIPVKKTLTLKKEYADFVKDYSLAFKGNLLQAVEPSEAIKKYYDLKEEPDWSQIKPRSVIGWNIPGDPPEKEEIGVFERYEEGYVVFKGHILRTKDYKWVFRVVELAKE